MKIRVIVLGEFKKTVDLFDTLRNIKSITLAGICDIDKDSLGMQYARRLKIPASADLAKMLCDKKPDVVMGATNSKRFLRILKRMARRGLNVVDSKTTELLLNIAQEKEKEVNKLKTDFIMTASHELRTPVAVLNEAIQLILDGAAGQTLPKQGQYLEIAKRNIDRMTVLINDLLDLSKIELGTLSLKIIRCDVKELIGKTIEPLKAPARANGIIIRHKIDKMLPWVECDPDRIAQVLAKLVANSIKFTPKGGEVTVISKWYPAVSHKINEEKEAQRKDYVEISVKDTGMGIGKEDIPRLFNRFGLLDASLTRKQGGAGLGLVLCRELVKMHGGGIHVKSRIGKGSTFTFTLPVSNGKSSVLQKRSNL